MKKQMRHLIAQTGKTCTITKTLIKPCITNLILLAVTMLDEKSVKQK